MSRCFFLLLLIVPIITFSQSTLLDEIDKGKGDDLRVISAFKGLKIVNFESTKMIAKKDFYFVVAHRFGSVKTGIKDFFGLDNANTRLSFIYGFTDWINAGISRSSVDKTYDLSIKYRFMSQQEKGFPVTIVGYSQFAVNTGLDEDLIPGLSFGDRLSITQQILISRKFSERFSFELIPTVFNEGFVDFPTQDNTQFALGFGGRYKLTKRWSFNVDYGLHLNRASGSDFKNPMSIGFDLETGGHVFQLHFTNAQQTYESGYLGNAIGDWTEGNFFFGFNLSRVF